MAPLPKDRRHPADYRDEIEHAEVAAVLSGLPHDHPARRAYSAAETSDSIRLSQLLEDRPDLVQRLIAAHTEHTDRIWARHRGTGVATLTEST